MSEPDMIERVARILEPQAWRALGIGDTLAYANRRTSSLRKARAAIEAIPSGITTEHLMLVARSIGETAGTRNHVERARQAVSALFAALSPTPPDEQKEME